MKKLFYILAPLLILGVVLLAQPRTTYATSIAFDAAAGGTSTGSLSLAVTGSGTNICIATILIGDLGTPADPTMTAHGKSMTLVDKVQKSGDRVIYLFAITAADQGTQNIVETGATFHEMFATSYTGCGGIDSHANYQSTADPSIPATTVVASNSWLVGFVYNATVSSSPTAGASTILRTSSLDNANMGDSNGVVGTGSQHLTFNWGNAGSKVGLILSFSPATAVAASFAPWQFSDF